MREPFGPFHGHQAPQRAGLLLFLGEQFIRRSPLEEPVKIQVHQGGGGPIDTLSAVVLRQGEGRTGDGLADAQLLGESLHQAGLAGPQIAPQEQQWCMPSAAARQQGPPQAPSQGAGGVGIVQGFIDGRMGWAWDSRHAGVRR